jgi:hypothetical protein
VKRDKVVIPKASATSAKRKLVGQEEKPTEKSKDGDAGKKKKKKPKGLLSFNEADGEE